MKIVKDSKEPVYFGSDSRGSTIVYRKITNRSIASIQHIAPNLYYAIEQGTVYHNGMRVTVRRFAINDFWYTWRVTSEYKPTKQYNLYESYWLDCLATDNDNRDYLQGILDNRSKRQYSPKLSDFDKFLDSVASF